MKRGRKPGTPRTGGRAKGTPNKATDETRALIEKALGGSPLEKMATLARQLLEGERVLDSEAKAIEVATKLLSEVAQYHSPKRKALEVSGPDGGSIPIAALKVEVIQSRAGSAS
jgi:hypothetical protein